MHSSGMRTARSLTISHSICHARPPAMHAPRHAWPPKHAPLPHTPMTCMPPTMHTSHHACSPCHTPPLCHTCPPMWTDRHLYKHNLRKLRLQTVRMKEKLMRISGVVVLTLMSHFSPASCVTNRAITVEKETALPEADPGFPVGGVTSPPGGGPTYDFARFSQKLHEIGKILGHKGGVST